MAAIAGLRGTGNWGTDERPKNFREMILWRDPNGSAPLTALMARTRSEAVDDPEFSWWEEELGILRLTVNGALTTGDTTVVVDAGDALELVAGDILLVEVIANGPMDQDYGNEFLEVSSVTNTTTFVVTRGAANTTAATIADDSPLTVIGNVFLEGSTSPDASTRNPTKFNNYCQIFKTSYRITETAKLTRARTGNALANDKKRKMHDHAVRLEYAYLLGKPYEDTSGTQPKRFTGGFLNYAATADDTDDWCVKQWTANATVATLLDAVYQIWDFSPGGRNSTERIGLCGNGFLNKLNKLANAETSTRVNFDGKVSTYGMDLHRWIFPQGELYLRTHPLFNIHGSLTDACFIINPGGLIDRPLRKTRSQDNIQANDADEEKGQWLTESGAEFHHLKTMSAQISFQVA